MPERGAPDPTAAEAAHLTEDAGDLALLTEAAREAAAIAMPFWRAEARVWHKADDAGPVTEADLAVDAMLMARLRAARPAYGWLSEETEDDRAAREGPALFVIDPIDGTRAFIAGDRGWSHALAVVRDHQVTAAVVFLPMMDKLYSATRGGGAHLNGAPIRASQAPRAEGASILAARTVLDPKHWSGPPPRMRRHVRSSMAYRLSLVAEGRFDAMASFRDTWEWDAAAGSLIATEAGATVTDGAGTALRFNNPRPAVPGLIAGAPAVHQTLAARAG